jgi:hypothetical protein
MPVDTVLEAVAASVPLDPNELVLDPLLQARSGIDPGTVSDYRERLRDGSPPPPVKVRLVHMAETLDRLLVTDGFHTVTAARLEGTPHIPCRVLSGTWNDALLEAAAANADHGLPRTQADRRRAVEMILDHVAGSEEWTSRKIAAAARVSHTLVQAVLKSRSAATAEAQPQSDLGINSKPKASRRDPERTEPDEDLGINSKGEAVASARPSDPILDQVRACPLYGMLEDSPDARAIFVADAGYYYRSADLRKQLQDFHRRHYRKAMSGVPYGVYPTATESFLRRPSPSEWLMCMDCGGERCDSCRQRGYVEAKR